MTTDELKAEWHYRYSERLALMGVFGNPTPQQHRIAYQEADMAVEKLKQQDLTQRKGS